VIASYGKIPPGAEAFPPDIQGTPFLAFVGAYAGPVEEGERVLQPLRRFSRPLADLSGRMPFVEAQKMLDEDYPARELRYYWKSQHLMDLSDQVIERLVDHASRQPSPLSTTDIWHIGGAVRRVSEEAMAFSGRNVPYLLSPEANWVDPKRRRSKHHMGA